MAVDRVGAGDRVAEDREAVRPVPPLLVVAAAVKSVKVSGAGPGSPPRVPGSVTIRRPPSMGTMMPPRPGAFAAFTSRS